MKRYVAVLGLVGLVAGCGDSSRITGSPVEPDRPVVASEAANSVTADSASITTDRSDYSPRDTVTFIGSGFKPFEAVTIRLHEDPFAHEDRILADTADANGDFINNDFVCEQHHLNVKFLVTVEGNQGSVAQTTFTDGARIQSVAMLGPQSPNPVPAGQSAQYGSVATSSLRVAFNGLLVGTCTVSLSASNLPAGVTANFSPSVLSGTAGQFAWSHLTVTTSPITPGGTVVFTVRATGTGGDGNACTSLDTEAGGVALSVLPNVATVMTLMAASPSQVLFGATGPVTFSATLSRTAGGPVVAGATVAFTVDGAPAGSAVTNASGVATLATYDPSALAPGNHTVLASFAGGLVGGVTLAGSTSNPQTLNVGKATPTIDWQNPADIIYGTALSSAQLNATASVPGTFVYSPAAGIVLNAGNGQSLSVVFTPADATNYNGANRTVSINVLRAPLTVAADDKSKIQGGVNPPLTGSVIGLQNGDQITATYSTTAATMSPPGNYPIVPALQDPAGRLPNYSVNSTNGTLTVLPNAPPVLGPVSAPTTAVPLGQSITASAVFTDADVAESQPYTATVSWGDWSSPTTQSYAVPGTISASHAYSTPGLYTVTISVRQDNLPATHGDTKQFQYVVVYDANVGTLTGGGWMDSPVGRATFGFVIRYEPGASVPTGNLEFQAHDGAINLKALSFEWLVVEGKTARFKGTGTLNGEGDYGFLATAVAGDPGSARLRIQIWDNATGATLYDTESGASAAATAQTRVGGGSIRIKR